MEQVPNIISTKDFAYLSDIFEWNYNASKECLHFSNEIEAEDIRSVIVEVSHMHSQICNEILAILGGE